MNKKKFKKTPLPRFEPRRSWTAFSVAPRFTHSATRLYIGLGAVINYFCSTEYFFKFDHAQRVSRSKEAEFPWHFDGGRVWRARLAFSVVLGCCVLRKCKCFQLNLHCHTKWVSLLNSIYRSENFLFWGGGSVYPVIFKLIRTRAQIWTKMPS